MDIFSTFLNVFQTETADRAAEVKQKGFPCLFSTDGVILDNSIQQQNVEHPHLVQTAKHCRWKIKAVMLLSPRY